MQNIYKIFSTREIALLIWFSLLLIWVIQKKKVRTSIAGIFKSLFNIQLLSVFAISLLYIIGIIFCLSKLNLWSKYLLKDTIFWFFSIAVVMIMNTNNVSNNKYFKNVFRDSIKWIIILEFIINFYTFNQLIELILIPIILLLATTQAFADVYSKREAKYIQANKFLTTVLGIFGSILILYSLYKTINGFNQLITFNNIKSIILPIILSLSISPLIYLFAVYMNYETFFIRIGFFIKDDIPKKKLKVAIFKSAKLNLSRLTRIQRNFNKRDLYQSENLDDFMRILKKY